MTSVLLAPGTVRVRFSVDPVYNNLGSLYMISLADDYPAVDDWVHRSAAALTQAQAWRHRVLFDVLYSAFEPDEEWPSFPAYLDQLARRDALAMRDRFLRHMLPAPDAAETDPRAIPDLERFVREIDRGEFDREVPAEWLVAAHALLADPPTLRETVVSHLRTMWHAHLAAEWERNEPHLRQIVAAFQHQDLSGRSPYQAIQTVAGREVHGAWQRVLARAETLLFIPSPHIGPYLLNYGNGPLVRVLFKAPPAAPASADPPRAELLVQLNALADETRLRILDLLLEMGQLCAQEIIARLDLSGSSASRHLSQLAGTGFLLESQGPGRTKCYTLNPSRFHEIMRFLGRYTHA